MMDGTVNKLQWTQREMIDAAEPVNGEKEVNNEEQEMQIAGLTEPAASSEVRSQVIETMKNVPKAMYHS